MKKLRRLVLFLAFSLFANAAFAQCVGGGSVTCFTAGGSAVPITIPESNPNAPAVDSNPNHYPSTIAVSGFSVGSTVSKVRLFINGISADRQGKIRMILVGPGGSSQQLMFMSDIGTFATAISNVNLVIDDAAASQMTAAPGTLVSGTYQPTSRLVSPVNDTNPGPASGGTFPLVAGEPADLALATNIKYRHAAPASTFTLANSFNGITPNGNWRLFVLADSTGLAGSIGVTVTGWQLELTTTAAAAPTSTTLTNAPNPTLTGQNVAFTATVLSNGNPVTQGTVTFSIDGAAQSPIAVNGAGQAVLNTTALAEGNHVIGSTYNGTANFTQSNSNTVAQEVNTATTNPSTNTYCNTGSISISGAAVANAISVPYPSKIFNVTGLSGTVTGLSLQLKTLSHGSPDDIRAMLVSPDNSRKFVFLGNAGGSSAVSGLTLTFSDAAGSVIPDNSGMTTATWLPSVYFNPGDTSYPAFPAPAPALPYNLGAPAASSTFGLTFSGANPNSADAANAWKLFVIDDSAGTGGSIAGGWCMTFTLGNDAATTTTVTSDLNPTFTTAPQNTATITATVRRADNSALVNGGTVTFRKGATTVAGPVSVVNGVATFTITGLNVGASPFFSQGDNTITAFFNGVSGFAVSSGSVVQEINVHTTETPTANGVTYCNPGGIIINAENEALPYRSKIFLPAGAGTLKKMTMSLNGLTHSFATNTVDMLLVGPNGGKIVPFSRTGGQNPASNLNLVLDDAAASLLPTTTLSSGTFRPTAYITAPALNFPPPAPASPWPLAASGGSATFANTFPSINAAGPWSLYTFDTALGQGGSIGSWCVNAEFFPDLTVTKSHSGNFFQSQTGAQYTVTVNNASLSPTSGTITVTDTLPSGLTATAIDGGASWTCTLSTLQCTRTTAIAANSSAPVITVTVNVASNAPAQVTNNVSVSGGGETNTSNNSASDITNVDPAVQITVNTNPAGRSFTVDGTTYTTQQVFTWIGGSNHSISTTSPQAGAAGQQFVWTSWSDGLAIAHNVTGPTVPTTYTANFKTQYQLTTIATAGGTIAPPSGFYDAGNVVITATADPNNAFTGFTGALTGTTNPQTLNLQAASTVTANFKATVQVTVNTNPSGRSFSVDGSNFTSQQTFTWDVGSVHSIATTSPQPGGAGQQFVWTSWSDGLAIEHSVTAPAGAITYTANFKTQYQLTTTAGTGGTIAPPSGFYDAGNVIITATPDAGFTFAGFTGALTGTTNPQTLNLQAVSTVNATFSQNTIAINVNTSPSGLGFTVDGTPYTTPQTFNWVPGSNHTIDTTSPQAGTPGQQFVFLNWSDSGAISHQVSPSVATTFTASFKTQYQLTTTAGTGGTIAPPSGFYDAGNVIITATANSGFTFAGFTGALTGTTNPQTLNLQAASTVNATFSQNTIAINVNTSPSGLGFSVDGTPYTTPQTFNWVPGSNHTIATTSPQAGTPGQQFVFLNWSDGGALSHQVAPTVPTTFTASFKAQYQLTTNAGTGGTIAPPSGFYDAGNVIITATANSGFTFAGFTGALTGTTNPQTLNLQAPSTVNATFTSSGATLSGLITAKVGPQNARVWSFTISNAGPGGAANAQLSALGLTQVAGAACTPVILSAIPAPAGTIGPGSSGTANVTIDFSGCVNTARFTVNFAFSANAGASTGAMTLFNQFR